MSQEQPDWSDKLDWLDKKLYPNRQSAIDARNVILKDLEREEKMCFFGSLYPGSHEPTQEGYLAAQENARKKTELYNALADLNELLGLSPGSREPTE